MLPTGFEVVWADTGSDPARRSPSCERLARERGVHLVIGGATSAEAQGAAAGARDARRGLPVAVGLDAGSRPAVAGSSFGSTRRTSSRATRRPSSSSIASAADQGGPVRRQHRVRAAASSRSSASSSRRHWGARWWPGSISSDPDWQSAVGLGAARSTGVDAVYIVGYAEEILEVLRHLAELGFEGRIVTTSAFYSSRVIREAGRSGRGRPVPAAAVRPDLGEGAGAELRQPLHGHLPAGPGRVRGARLRRHAARDRGDEDRQAAPDPGDPAGDAVRGHRLHGRHRTDPVRRLRRRQALPEDVHRQGRPGSELPALPQDRASAASCARCRTCSTRPGTEPAHDRRFACCGDTGRWSRFWCDGSSTPATGRRCSASSGRCSTRCCCWRSTRWSSPPSSSPRFPGGDPYPLFLFSGLLPWLFFSGSAASTPR